ncbi:hypothetical protein Cch01nite_17260 [Cellulomonas chitinilytica]|uniref:FtsX-like permease family protein n=1 Tax=Cellulomonas chitinilytica TaxID=398759 RepID=A0A919P2M3_9CELL|nr:hypothetical protein [Cellulomonas chitinilytica]GIG21002.1 hypothetical protein Cch01nite_17260 [Cellulomonas chitinilytica]
MSATRLLLRRARAHAGLLGLVLLLVAVVSATVTGMVASTLAAARDTARDALHDPVDASLQVSTRLADDPDAQSAAADRALAAELAGTPTTTDRTLRSLSLPVRVADRAATDARLVLGADAGLRQEAHLVDGAWPGTAQTDGSDEQPDETVLHAAAARALGVDVGDSLVVTGDGGVTRTVRVVGTWLPDDPDAVRWAGEGLVRDGVDGTTGAFGPAVVGEQVLAAVPGIDMVRWTVVPDLARVQPAGLAGLADRLDAFVADVERTVGSGGVATTGELPATLRGTATTLDAVAAVTSSALALVALASVVALAQVARLLAAVRATETTVLRSRGATVGQLTRASALEAAAVAVPAVALGALLAALVVPAVRDVDVAVPVVVGAVAVVLVGTVTLTLGARAAAVRAGERTDPAGRSVGTVATGALVLTLLTAALATWRLLRTATGPGDPSGGAPAVAGTEPAAIAAVPLGVLAVALLSAAALRPVTALVARAVAGRGDLVVPLAARQLARRAALYAVPVVLVTLATATAGLAAVYTGTSQGQARTATATAVGADVRATLSDLTALQVDEAPPTDAMLGPGLDAGATAAAPVLRTSADAASATGTALAMPARRVADVVRDDGVPGLAVAASTLAGPTAWRLPDGTSQVRFDVDLGTPATDGVAWWFDADGRLRSTSAEPAGDAWTAQAPARAVALAAVELAPADTPAGVTVAAVTAVGPDGTTDLLAGGPWRAAQPGSEPVVEAADGPTVALPPSSGLHPVVRVLPGKGAPSPVVLSQEWAAQDGLVVGSPVELRLAGHPVDAVVSAVLPVVPGAPGRAALVDLASAGDALLATAVAVPAPAEAWFAAADPGAVADEVTGAATAAGLTARAVTAEPTPDRATAAAAAALVAAAACLLAMALPGVAAAALALSRARHPEVGVLHALGVRPRSQARGRSAETGVVLGTALLGGSLGGLALGALLAPALVQVVARGPAELDVVPAASAQVAAALLGAAAVGSLLVVLADGRLVLRQAATGTVREDVR